MTIKKLLAMAAVGAAMVCAPQVRATGTLDSATNDSVDSIKVTTLSGIVICTTVVTAALGLRLYKKLGKRAIGSA
jgi:hypothetical protein